MPSQTREETTMSQLEELKTYKTFPYVISNTIKELRNAELVLGHVIKQLRGTDPENLLSHTELITLAAILEQQGFALAERADLLFETEN
jgi:hypothetical protein